MTETKIIQGDMFKLLPQMDDNSFDYIFTSPLITGRETINTSIMTILLTMLKC